MLIHFTEKKLRRRWMGLALLPNNRLDGTWVLRSNINGRDYVA
jgi:hypothetical protein